MKKLFLLLIVLLVLVGCGNKNEEPTPSPEPDPQPEPTAAAEPRVIPDDIFEWLDGNWQLSTRSEDTNMTVTLTFDATLKTVKILRNDGEYIVCDMELIDSYEPLKNDGLLFKFKEASDFFITTYGTSEYMYQSYMQFFTGYFEDQDFLILREMGNGMSVIDMDALGSYEKMAGDYGWMFIRTDTGNKFPTLTDNEALKIKDGKFYAYCWARGDTYLLQKVEVLEQEEEWYEDFVVKAIRVIPDETEYKYTAFLYGGEAFPYDMRPGLVKVSVSNGAIYDLREIAYLGYGAYDGE